MNLWPFAKPSSSVTPWMLTAEGASLLASKNPHESPAQLDVATLIVPRKFLFYQCFDLESVPRPLRANLIQQRLKQVSPFTYPASWQVAHGDLVQVWFWDASRVTTALSQQSDDFPAVDVLPELAFYEPLANGLRIQSCQEGIELQYWHQHVLKHSRWFAYEPNERELRDFVRVCGAEEGLAWQQGTNSLLSKPWNEKPFWSKENLTSEAVAPRLVLGVLLAWLILQLGLSIGTQIHEKILATSVASKTKQLKTLVRERDGALQQQEFNQAVMTLIDNPSQLHLLAQVQACFPADGKYSILDWQYQHGQLTLVVQQDNLDTRALIQACSANAAFSEVHVEPGITPDQTRVLFTLPDSANSPSNASDKKEGGNA